VPVAVPAGLAGRVRRAASDAGATVPTVLLAAFAVLLGRRAGGPDLLIGLPRAGRDDAALSEIVGPFATSLPLRVDLTGRPTFTELVRQVRAGVLGGLEHAGVPFEAVAERAGPDAARQVARVWFAWAPVSQDRLALGLATAEVRVVRPAAAGAELGLTLYDEGAGFSGALEYRADGLSPAGAAALAAEFTDLLARLTEEGAGEIRWTTTPSLTS
jgi:non-ribosomal peptide synthetase component F